MQIALAQLGLGQAVETGTVTSRSVEAARRLGSGCPSGSMKIFGRCVPKLYLYGGVGAVGLAGLLLVMRRRAAA